MADEEPISEAERLFEEYLEQVEHGNAPPFANLLDRHPGQAAALTRLHENWQLIRALAGGAGGVQVDALSEGDTAWGDFLERLQDRAPRSRRYEVQEEMARGGMGAIFRVYEENLRRTLAMKVALPESDAGSAGDPRSVDPLSMGRFLEEAQVTAQLDHPGIVPVHELSVDDEGRVFFTMKLVKGDNLLTIFSRISEGAEGWTWTRALGVLLRACEALAFAHSKGVIHRDLKPANIMVGRFGETYVMDWGVARVLGQDDRCDLRWRPEPSRRTSKVVSERSDDLSRALDSPLVTMDGQVVGTPAYMSPEQAAGRIEVLSPQSDVYGMGAILYELFTGRMPYTEPGVRISPRTVLARVLDGPPRSIAELNPAVPPELVAIAEKAMARDMARRYPSMEELAADLRAFLEQRVVKAYAAGPLAEFRKWVGRNRSTALLAVIALLSVVLLAFGLAWQQNRAARTIAAERDRAQADRDRLLQISDVRRLADLLEEMNELWPALPETVPRMQAWLEKARALQSRLPRHEETLAALRREASAGPHRLDVEMREWLVHRDKDLARPLGVMDEKGEAFHTEAEKQEHIDYLNHWIGEMGKVMKRERVYDFGADTERAWWHDALFELVVGLEDLALPDAEARTIASIEKRLEFASNVEFLTLDDPADAWEGAIESIADRDECPQYDGLRIEPQLGLVPIGRDRDSGLWEFVYLLTGESPSRNSNGELIYTEESGVVLVLLPGGEFLLGGQKDDPRALRYDPWNETGEGDVFGKPVMVQLDPYFISKYEMTQGQWLRATGENPSFYAPDMERVDGRRPSLLFPVENVSWVEAERVMGMLGLILPSEAQWEVACRGGTDSVWWTGDEIASLQGAANLADETALDEKLDWPRTSIVPELNDTYLTHAPVHLFRANPFGLHHVHGNVYEWVHDSYTLYTRPANPGDGRRELTSRVRVARSGSFQDHATRCRSAYRGRIDRHKKTSVLGLRPARRLDRN